jgi:hypothetical protein
MLLLNGLSSTSSLGNETIPGWALGFDGSDDFLMCPNIPAYQTHNFTVELWAKQTLANPTGSRVLVSTLGYMPNGGWQICASPWFRFTFRSGGTGHFVDPPTTTLPIGEWVHLAVSYIDNGVNATVSFYINGDQLHQTTLAGVIIDYVETSPTLFIGANIDWQTEIREFPGEIDEVRIWGYCRTSSEIKAAMNRRLNADERENPLLLAYWPFEEGAGLCTSDLSLNAIPCSLHNGVQWVQNMIPISTTRSGWGIIKSLFRRD